MENYGYEKPVSELLRLGRKKLESRHPETWMDYIGQFGFTSEHIPELIKLYEDETFQDSDFWEEPEGLAFVHVINVLGQLGDRSALPFLLNLAETEKDSDWVWENVPTALSLFDKDILPDLKASVQRVLEDDITATTVLNAMNELAKRNPDIQQEVFDFWVELLEDYEKNDYGLNARLISYFANFKYEPVLPLIEKAFKAKRVDEFYSGDYFDILVDYGLQEDDPNRKKDYFGPSGEIFKQMRQIWADAENPVAEHDAPSFRSPFDYIDNSNATKPQVSKKKKKAKRKQAKKSRKQNRKKK